MSDHLTPYDFVDVDALDGERIVFVSLKGEGWMSRLTNAEMLEEFGGDAVRIINSGERVICRKKGKRYNAVVFDVVLAGLKKNGDIVARTTRKA